MVEAAREQSQEASKRRKEETKRQSKSSKILEFKVFREDDHDAYKQNAPSALTKLVDLTTTQKTRPATLTLEDLALFETISTDLDRSMSLEDIISNSSITRPPPEIPGEIRQEIDRLPSWLQSMVIHKYPLIHAHYQENTTRFFHAIANRIEKQYRSKLKGWQMDDDEPSEVQARDPENMDKVQFDYYKLNEDDLNVSKDKKKETESLIAFRVAHAVDKWKATTKENIENPQRRTDFWEPKIISRANFKLRSALQTRATTKDNLTLTKDQEMLRVDKVEETDDQNFILTKNPKDYWHHIFDTKHTVKAAEHAVEKHLAPHHNRKDTKERAKKLKEIKKLEQLRKTVKVQLLHRRRMFVTKHGRRRKKRILLTRGYFRDYSRLFSGRPTPKRLARPYRSDGSFHEYCVALVNWFCFKILVMFVIGLNAIVLALETFDLGDASAFYFEIIDNIFVAVYSVECMLKIYAHHYTYWRSGFNIFDFCILVASVIKNAADWTNAGEIDILRAILIVRALRILRGISLSVQLQILLSALIETIRSHVLSVVLLLVLLLYVTSIVAFYLFGEQYPAAFGRVGIGMLNMLQVLTIDGWTDLNAALILRAGSSGTFFMITCIVLGNFLFSNIFVAIIIMNISEATDNFRDKQREKRETVVRMKKEKVFQRHKLDLRQLLFRQPASAYMDFFTVGQNFEKLLRHDDLVAIKDVITSPLWMDSMYETIQRANHTSAVLMNLHREMADNLLDLFRLYKENKMICHPIRRARYNRYLRMKAKLALIKEELLKDRAAGQVKTKMKFS